MQKSKGIKKLLSGTREKVVLVIDGDIYFLPDDDITGKRTKINYAVDTQDMDCFGFSWEDFYDGKEWQQYYKRMIELTTKHITYADALKNANAVKFKGEMNRALNIYYAKCDNFWLQYDKQYMLNNVGDIRKYCRKNHFEIMCYNGFINGPIVVLVRKNYHAFVGIVINNNLLLYDHTGKFLGEDEICKFFK